MTLTEVIEGWVRDAERMSGDTAQAVVVTAELFAHLAREQSSDRPEVAGFAALVLAPLTPETVEMVEIPGPDRVSIYVGVPPEQSPSPVGLDPAMPVVFVPVPPHVLHEPAQLEMYNRLRWYGLGPEEAMAGSG